MRRCGRWVPPLALSSDALGAGDVAAPGPLALPKVLGPMAWLRKLWRSSADLLASSVALLAARSVSVVSRWRGVCPHVLLQSRRRRCSQKWLKQGGPGVRESSQASLVELRRSCRSSVQHRAQREPHPTNNSRRSVDASFQSLCSDCLFHLAESRGLWAQARGESGA